MTILVDGRSYKISNVYVSIDDVANMLAVSREFVEDSIKMGHIYSEKCGNQTMIPTDFVERLLFGTVNKVLLSSDTSRDKGPHGEDYCETVLYG